MRKLRAININNILFLDIETAPIWEHFKDVPDNVRKEWVYKFKFRANAPQPLKKETLANTNHDPEGPFAKAKAAELEQYFADLWEKEAGLYPEFSRIICISYGYLEGATFRIKSSYHENERELLQDFTNVIDFFWERNKAFMVCAHNGKGFDFPYIVKRLLFHRAEVPMVFDTYGLKPWEITTQIDTLEVWKMGAFQGGGGGLPSIALHFGIPTPKDDIEGSDVSGCYHRGELNRIVIYCQKDVVTLLQVFRAMRCEALLPDGSIQFAAL